MSQTPVRRRLGRWLVSSLLLPVLSIACTPSAPPSGSGLICGGNRWIGIKPGGSACTTFLPAGPTSWQAANLFGGTTVSNLERYCVFEWNDAVNPTPTAADVAALSASAGALKGFAEDCPVIAPLAFPEEISVRHRRSMHEAAGGLSSLPASASLAPTRLAVVDNAPDSLDVPRAGAVDMRLLPRIQPHTAPAPYGEHGEVLAYIGRDLGCPEEKGACPVHVETALALRDGGSSKPDATGGLSGRRGDLAQAVRRTVADWKDDLGSGGEARLVINLSVGWEDHPEDDDCHVAKVEDLNAPSLAVYDALVEARCHGAFIVAAAGNDTGSGSSGGLVCPAHFATWATPECGKKTYDVEFDSVYAEETGLQARPPTTKYDPLVHPIGAVDFGDQPLSPHRPRSLPRVVAPGFLGASYEGYFSSFQSSTLPAVAPYPLTGTSVSTLVVSAIVAAGWAYDPQRAPADIMTAVYDFGAPLSPTAEVSPLTTPARVHRASLCRTLKGMLILPASTTCSDPNPGTVANQNAQLSSPLRASMNAYFGASSALTATSSPTTPLARFPTESAGSFVSPQPIWPGCPSCGIEPALEAIIHIDPPANTRFANTHLVVSSAGGAQSYSLGSISQKSSFTLSRNVVVAAQNRVYLVWEESSGTAAYAQIPVW